MTDATSGGYGETLRLYLTTCTIAISLYLEPTLSNRTHGLRDTSWKDQLWHRQQVQQCTPIWKRLQAGG